MKELFEKQLAEAVECSGDYLNGKTFEEGVANYLLLPGNEDVSQEKAESFIQGRVAEFAAHKGEKLLFAIVYSQPDQSLPQIAFQVVKIWSGELDTLHEKYRPYIMQDAGSMPRLLLK